MTLKIVFGVIAILLAIAFLAPILWKLKEVSLFVVAAIGLALMIWEFWETIRNNNG